MIERKLILFGAGEKGIEAKKHYGEGRIAFFCDNNVDLIGKTIEGIEVIPFDRMKELYDDNYIIMITPINNIYMIAQLENAGIKDYLLYVTDKRSVFNHLTGGVADTWWDNVIDEYVLKCSDLDLLTDVACFKQLSREVIELTDKHGVPLKSGRLWEGFHYGNLQSLAEYAGINDSLIEYSPLVSHIDCAPVLSAEFYREATIMSGEYYKYKIHQRFPYVPVFSVGPYIYYSKGIYSDEQFLSKKKEIGRMLLVFLPHSEEFVHRIYDKNSFVDEILTKYRSCFDTIWLCSFWVDINDDVCKYAEERGIHVVSAGFRFDASFDKRLRTIIELSDSVLCADIGTFIAYSLMLNKPISRVDIGNLKHIQEMEVAEKEDIKDLHLVAEYRSFEKRFSMVFTDSFTIKKEQYAWMEPYAGFSKIRDREYIKSIFNISKDIYDRCEKYDEEYPIAVRKTYYEYYNKDMIEKMIILKSAVGGYLD